MTDRVSEEEADMAIKVIGLDIAKSVFQVHGVDEAGQAVLRRRLRRAEVLKLFAGIEPALVGIEACHTAHYWAREIAALGHEVRLMPPQFVKPYIKSQKNDAADAAADSNDKRLPEVARACVAALGAQLRMLKAEILQFDRMIRAWHRSSEASRRLDDIPGVGPIAF
jgi:transposase